MHTVLERQLKKIFGSIDKVPQEIQPFIALVDAAYTHADEDRRMVEHSLEVSSREMRTLYENLKKESESLRVRSGEADESKRAVLNLLEDLEVEKGRAEALVQQRTKELREEKARLLASINSLSFGFVIADAEDHILLKNPAIRRILDFKIDPESIHDIAESFKSDDGTLLDFNPTASCKECMDLRKVIEIKRVSYGQKFLCVFCAPIMVEETKEGEPAGSKVIGYVFLVEDTTEAVVAERSRDEFFAVASHELRTPLTAIRGNSDMILDMYADKIVDEDMKEMLRDMNISSIRLIEIVNDFLEVSRLEQGKIEMKKEPFAIGEVISKVVRDMRGAIERKGVTLTADEPAVSLPLVLSDKNRVEQVLLNLVGNAEKFTTAGSIRITTDLLPGFLKVRVIDTGSGISEHNQALLLRKFQQAGEQVLARDVTQGTGLGLYVSKLIVSTLGGTIDVEASELGKGSTFAFTVPLVA